MVTRHLCDTGRSEQGSQICELQVDTDGSEELHLLELTMNFELGKKRPMLKGQTVKMCQINSNLLAEADSSEVFLKYFFFMCLYFIRALFFRKLLLPNIREYNVVRFTFHIKSRTIFYCTKFHK